MNGVHGSHVLRVHLSQLLQAATGFHEAFQRSTVQFRTGRTAAAAAAAAHVNYIPAAARTFYAAAFTTAVDIATLAAAADVA